MPKFYNQDVADLAHQLTLSPRRLRLEQIYGIQRLISLVEPNRAYPFDFVCYHITKFRKRAEASGFAIPGKALTCDLVTLAEVISRKANLAVSELGESYETHQELAERLKVSTKTIRRWRNKGLLGIRAVFEDGVNRLAFLRSAVDQFVGRFQELVAKGAFFRQLTAEERDTIVTRARQLLGQRRLKLHAIAKLVAEETGRAVETVRYTLRRHDESAGAGALFRKDGDVYANEQAAAMWNAYEAGEPASSIALAHDIPCEEVERTLREVQVRKWQQSPPDCIYNELFDAPNADAVILSTAEPVVSAAPLPRVPKDLPAYLRSLYATPLLTGEQERDLFRRYNFLKFKAAKLLKAMKPEKVAPRQVEAVRGLLSQVEEFRRRIVQANLRLVVSIAKKHVGWTESFYEVVSDGNMSLMRAVEKFDYALGNKFSTYASWAIMKNYARSIPEDHYYCKRFVTGQEEVLEAVPDVRSPEAADADRQQVKELLAAGMRALSDREREVLVDHFGLQNKGVGLTLEQIGKRFGVTKERVRQIEQQAITRLRGLLAPSLVDALVD